MCVAYCHLIEHLHYKCQERLRVAFRQPSRRRRWCILKSAKRLGVNQGIQEILALLSEETTREIYVRKLAQNYKEVLSPLSGSQGAICLHSIGYILSKQSTSCSQVWLGTVWITQSNWTCHMICNSNIWLSFMTYDVDISWFILLFFFLL